MSFEMDPIYLVYILVAVSAGLFFEGIYLLGFSAASYRSNVNRRLKLLKNEPNREALLVQLRRERGLTHAGGYAFGPAPQPLTAPGVVAISATNLQGIYIDEKTAAR